MATILVVDDEADVRRFLKSVLGYRAHHVLEAAGGLQALSFFDTENPELVITDIVMPVMDGLDFLRRLRIHPRGRSIPVIIHTGLIFDEKARAMARACGVQLVMEKPSQPRTILDTVELALRAPPAEVNIPAEFERDHLQLLTDQLTRKLHELHAEMERRERAESERDQLVQQLRLQIDRLPLAFLRMDADFRVLDWNPAAERMFGYTRHEALGQSVLELLLPHPLPDSVRDTLRRMQAGDMSANSVNENRTKDGRLITCEWFNTPLMDRNRRFAGAIFVAQDITLRREAEAKVQEYYERAKGLSRQLLTVQEEERRHLARELHDEIGQVLSAISVNLKVVKSKVAPDARPPLEESIDMVDRAVDQVRNLSLDLRPSMLDDSGLESALRWYVDRLGERTGLPIHFSAESSLLEISGPVRNACYRVAQEALTNVVRHAHAREVWVDFHGQDEEIRLEIRDNGSGFDVAAALNLGLHGGSLGLLGMQERGELLGGRVEIVSQPERGTTIRARWPLTVFSTTGEAAQRDPTP